MPQSCMMQLSRWLVRKKAVVNIIKTSCRRAAATVCPRPSAPPWVPKRFAPPNRRQRSSSFPHPTRSHAHRCSRLTRQHGGEQSGLLTFDLLTLKVVSESRVTWATSVPILVFLGSLFWFRPDVRDRQTSDRQIWQTSDRRQTKASLNAATY